MWKQCRKKKKTKQKNNIDVEPENIVCGCKGFWLENIFTPL